MQPRIFIRFAMTWLLVSGLGVFTGTAADATFTLRINCGAQKSWTDPAGHLWEADREYVKGAWGAVDGATCDRGDIHVAGTDIEPIYHTERYDLSEYRITCPNGKYQVRLHFAETYGPNKPGGRVFTVVINDQDVLGDMDPVKASGSNLTAVVKLFDAQVQNGLLSIAFTGIVSGPEINGIEIIQSESLVPPSVTQRILDESPHAPGLCVYVGCGRASTPEQMAELATGSQWLVHGLAADDAALLRARLAIDQHHVTGQAMVEKMTGRTLPYASRLANVVVVEDFEVFSAMGLTSNEVLRIAVPGGVVWLQQQGRWDRMVKPWLAKTDEWTHPHHSADGNRFSTDAEVQFPASLRWEDGVPSGLGGATRGVVAAGGRVFAVGPNVVENVGPFRRMSEAEYLTARDVFNGLTLWKVPTGNAVEWFGYNSINIAPLVTDGQRVYLNLTNRLFALAADTGEVKQEFAVKYPATRLLLADGILVAAGWPEKKASQEKGMGMFAESLWAPMISSSNQGSLQAFDAAHSTEKWSKSMAVQEALISHGLLFVLCQEGNPANSQSITAIELATGVEKWRTGNDVFAPERGVHLGVAGAGVLSVTRARAKKTSVLSAASGELLWGTTGTISRLVSGLLWVDGQQYDPRTGNVKGTVAQFGNGALCTPGTLVGSYLLQGRANGVFKMSDDYSTVLLKSTHSANRGGCFEGYVIADGMILSAENNCACQTGQMPGFFALAAADAVPQKKDFDALRPVEHGPAYGLIGKAQVKSSADDWPMLLGNAQRNSCSRGVGPSQLKLLWQTQLTQPPRCKPLAAAWQAQCSSGLSAPVGANGRIFVADVHRGELIALDAVTGRTVWKTTVGGCIDGPPAVWKDLCVFGGHDGWVYALRVQDGVLAWRTRVAPLEQRMMAFGAIESSWPAIGPVMIVNDQVFVSAGRATETDGGLALLALDLETGKQIWAARADTSPGFQNDILRMVGNNLILHTMQIDPQNGDSLLISKIPPHEGLNGWRDGTWTRIPARRSGGRALGRATGELLAWDEQKVFGFSLRLKSLFALALEKTTATNAPTRADYTWLISQRNVQPEALMRSADALFAAGTFMDYDMSAPPKGLLWRASAETGQPVSELQLSAPPIFDGLALVKNRIYVALEDGSVVCAGTP